MKFKWKNYISLIFILFAVGGPLGAQVRSASITGTITDSSGAVIVDANVVARDEATNVEYNGKTT